jgi:hypothetical protein
LSNTANELFTHCTYCVAPNPPSGDHPDQLLDIQVPPLNWLRQSPESVPRAKQTTWPPIPDFGGTTDKSVLTIDRSHSWMTSDSETSAQNENGRFRLSARNPPRDVLELFMRTAPNCCCLHVPELRPAGSKAAVPAEHTHFAASDCEPDHRHSDVLLR